MLNVNHVPLNLVVYFVVVLESATVLVQDRCGVIVTVCYRKVALDWLIYIMLCSTYYSKTFTINNQVFSPSAHVCLLVGFLIYLGQAVLINSASQGLNSNQTYSLVRARGRCMCGKLV